MNKRLTISIIAVAILTLGVGYAVMQSDTSKINSDTAQDSNSSTSDYSDSNDRVDEDQVPEDRNNDAKNVQPDGDKRVEPEEQPPENPPIEKPHITRYEQSGDAIRVSAIFNTISSGTCRLTLEKAGHESIVRSAEVVVGPNYYACDGFRIPIAELPAMGEWKVSVAHLQGNQSVSSDTYKVTVK
ncbi:MAG: hypothetical protein WD467_02160 [Candidatus Saccharimonadales bacterium]